MSPAARPASRRVPPRRGPRGATLVAGAVALLVAVMALVEFRAWRAADAEAGSLALERETLRAKNAALAGAHDILVNQKVQICNKSADAVTVEWLAAAYQDASRVRLFDSSRCSEWRPPSLKPGESRTLNLSSTDAGCNWNGSVIFYAMHLRRESEDASRAYNVSGAWRGFDRDCFTLE